MTNRNFLKNVVILSSILSGTLGGANTFAFDSVNLWNDAWDLTCCSYKTEYDKYQEAMEYVEKFLNGEQVKTSDKQPQNLKITDKDAKASILVAVCRAIFNYTASIDHISEGWYGRGVPALHLEHIRCDIEKARKLGDNFGWPDESVECGEKSGIGHATGEDARSYLRSALSRIDKLFNKQNNILTPREKFELHMIDIFHGDDKKITEAMIKWDEDNRDRLTTDGDLLY